MSAFVWLTHHPEIMVPISALIGIVAGALIADRLFPIGGKRS